VVLALALAPAALATGAGHPFGLSQYAPLVGGPRGAADLGLNRGFWGHSVRPLLDDLPRRGKIYVHDVHEQVRQQYEREGDWPPGLASTPISRSTSGLIFHELHMTTYEVQLWNQVGTATPAMIIDLHDVPLTTYVAPRPGGG
jgi:hypothetical protein